MTGFQILIFVFWLARFRVNAIYFSMITKRCFKYNLRFFFKFKIKLTGVSIVLLLIGRKSRKCNWWNWWRHIQGWWRRRSWRTHHFGMIPRIDPSKASLLDHLGAERVRFRVRRFRRSLGGFRMIRSDELERLLWRRPIQFPFTCCKTFNKN